MKEKGIYLNIALWVAVILVVYSARGVVPSDTIRMVLIIAGIATIAATIAGEKARKVGSIVWLVVGVYGLLNLVTSVPTFGFNPALLVFLGLASWLFMRGE